MTSMRRHTVPPLTALRSTLGQVELDDLLTERDNVNHRLQEIIDQHTEPWGVKAFAVEVKDVDLPDAMKRSMARQAEAERDRRAKVINAEGEYQAAEKLRQAADIMAPYPLAMQMRYLQALADVASDENSTIVFPLPLDLMRPFLEPKAAPLHGSAQPPATDLRPRRGAGANPSSPAPSRTALDVQPSGDGPAAPKPPG